MRPFHPKSVRTFALVFAAASCLTAAGGIAVSAATGPGSSARRHLLLVGSAGSSSAGGYAAGWLGRQFLSNGDLPKTDGEAGVDYLPLAIVALVSADVGGKEIAKGIGYLEEHFAAYVEVPVSKTKSVAAPGRLAAVILAAVAAKKSPEHFGGTKAVNDLVARLLATQIKSGADKGLFGSPGSPTYSSAYTQGLSLAALAAVGKINSAGADWLVRQQCSDGGWETYRVGTAKCPAPDPKTFSGPDTNDTALAIEGLVASKVSPKVSPVPFLEAAQYASGGFGYYGGHSSAQPADTDSTALVAQALVALGKLSSVKRGGKGAEAGLAVFQLGCASPASQRGSYTYPKEPGPNLYATIQAIPAAMRAAYPISPGSPSSALPVMPCK